LPELTPLLFFRPPQGRKKTPQGEVFHILMLKI
jgi:hypothetical protein